MKKITFILIILFTIISCKKSDKTERENQPTIYNVESQDAEMNNIIIEAKQTLPEFYKALESKNTNQDSFAIKIHFKVNNDGEHIWVNGLFKRDGEYFGVVDNLPELTKEVKQGDTIKIDSSNVSDWMYLDNGELKGGYTIRLLRNRMSEEERAEFDKTSGMVIR
ncbi:MAG: DUF2314 domain-containing protein [Flavobacterium sp.]